MLNIFNGDCFDILSKFKPEEKDKVDLVCLDLPYGQTCLKWDSIIDLKKMWIELKRICKDNCVYIFFCTTKFGYKLIQSNEKWFRYDLVWEKSRKVGFLSANKMPLRKHEMLYVFADKEDDLDNSKNKELRAYSEKVFKFIGKTMKEIKKDIGSYCAQHFFSYRTTQFELPTEKTYDILIKIYKLRDMEGFREYKSISTQWNTDNKNTYNPQKVKGKPYKTNGRKDAGIYGDDKGIPIDNKGTRHPTTIVKFNNPKKSLHPTQKPVDLLEWIIKSYTNKDDLVLDFTMGSGSCGVACLNTGRDFIGIEKDPKIYNTAHRRLFLSELNKAVHND